MTTPKNGEEITEGCVGLYKLLKSAGGCVRQLSDELQVSRQTIYNWSMYGMPKARAEKYAQERGIPLDEFLLSSRRIGRPRRSMRLEQIVRAISDEL